MPEESILIIDDEPSVLKIASRILENAGYAVNTAETARQALKVLGQNNIAVAISDHFLPDINGIDLFEKTKLSYPHIYRILVTGKQNLDLKEAINRAEVHYFLNKPFSPEELRWAVKRVLEQRRHRLQYEAVISDLDRLATAKAEAAVAFERRYRAVVEQMMALIILARWDDGTIIEMNPQAQNLLGVEPGEEKHLSLPNIFASERFFLEVKQVLERHRKIYGAESAICLPSGEEIPVNVAAYILNDPAEGKTILAILNDLSTETELQYRLTETHAWFRATLDAISDPIFSVDSEKRIVFANEAMNSLYKTLPTGVTELSCCEVIGDKKQRNQCMSRLQGSDCPVDIVLKTGNAYSDQLHCHLGTSEKNWWDRTIFPVQGRDGQIKQVVMVMRNVTSEVTTRKQIDTLNKELKEAVSKTQTKNESLSQALAELKETQSFLLQSEKMASIGQLAAGVAHEINNPVGFINSNLNSLAEYAKDLKALLKLYEEVLDKTSDKNAESSKVQEARQKLARFKQKIDLNFLLEDIEDLIHQSLDGTDRVKKIVADLKDFSHVDRPELEYADINRGMESTLNIVWNELKYKATVKKDYGDLPPILCFPRQINQVFMNLLINAAQAIETKGEITIVTRTVDTPRPGIEIKISDNGIGIPSEIRERIFEPFFTTKPVGKGTGLGLNVCYKIIQAHNGEIKVESEVGKGTTFSVYLPFLEEDDFPDQDPEKTLPG